jgi:siroheme synthase (precorrin-2 oxidase/ferrochelatase)
MVKDMEVFTATIKRGVDKFDEVTVIAKDFEDALKKLKDEGGILMAVMKFDTKVIQ